MNDEMTKVQQRWEEENAYSLDIGIRKAQCQFRRILSTRHGIPLKLKNLKPSVYYPISTWDSSTHQGTSGELPTDVQVEFEHFNDCELTNSGYQHYGKGPYYT